jgi:uncharacterized membrane protein
MVIDHAYDWWLIEKYNQGSWGRFTEFLGTLAAPIFFILVGVSQALVAAKSRARGMTPRQVAYRSLRRGGSIVLWGYAVNFLTFFNGDNWSDLFAFDVLHCIGAGIIVFTPLVLWAPLWLLPILAIILGWGGQYADRLVFPGYLGTMLNGNPPIAYFPILPWVSFIPLGILWGKLFVRWRDCPTAKRRLFWGLALVGGLTFAGVILVPPDIGYRHPYLISILFDLTVVSWLTVLLYNWIRVFGMNQPLEWLCTLGQETLLVYIVHHFVGFRLFSWLGWVTGRSWRGKYGIFDIRQATLLLVLLLLAVYILSRWWSKLKRSEGRWGRIARSIR